MEEPARDAYLELLKQRLTRTYTLGEFRTGGRRHRAVALVMQVLADRGLNDRSSRPVRPSAVRSVRPGPPRVTAPGAHARPAPARNRPRRVAATQTPPYWGRVAGTPRRSCPHRARETGPACRALLPACFEHLAGCGKSRDFGETVMKRARYGNPGLIKSTGYEGAKGDESGWKHHRPTFSAAC